MSWDIQKWAVDLDRAKIGWPWHGLLQQVSDTMCTLTSPTGEVVNFPNGDTSHPISSAVALTSTASWRYGRCQQFKIPGHPAATTTPAEKAQGITWQNWFCRSGIANIPGGGDVLIDESNKVWRTTTIFSGYRPAQLVIWHGVNGAWAEKMRVTIPDPAFQRSIINFFNLAMTSSSTGRLRIYSIYEYGGPAASHCLKLTVTGSVADGSIAINVEKLMDYGIPDQSGVLETDTLYSGSSSDATTLWLMRATRSTPGSDWSSFALDPSGQTTTWNRSRTYSNSPNPTPAIVGNDGYPTAPAGDELTLYGWSAHPSSPTSTFSEQYQSSWVYERTDVFAPWSLLGYFVGTDDQVVPVRSYLTRTTVQSGDKHEGAFTNTHQYTKVISTRSHATIGGRSTAGQGKTQTIVQNVQTNTTVSDTTTGNDGQVVNLLCFNNRAVVIGEKLTASVLRHLYIAGQFSDAAIYPSASGTTWPPQITSMPKFSIHPVTGEIATRVNDGRPISWV